MNSETKEKIVKRIKLAGGRWGAFFINLIASAIVGALVGTIGAAFAYTLNWVTNYRMNNFWLLYFLPVAGMLIVLAYKILLRGKPDGGTNIVISAVHSGDDIPLAMAPLIFFSTALTHLVGGSAGREGAALQLGGSIGDGIAKIFKANRQVKSSLVMCGMTAAFSALFGTPMAAAIFPIEFISVGIMHYSSLLPNVVAALVARAIAARFGLHAEQFDLGVVPAFSLEQAVRVSVLAALAGVAAIIFILGMEYAKKYFKIIKNPYFRVFVGGTIVLILSLVEGQQTFNGSGMSFVEGAFDEPVKIWVFLLKILFTALTLGCGYKGGEIVPTLFIGATFGSAISVALGLPVGLATAVGMCCLFCSVTNAPLTALLIAFELFGYEAMPYYLLGVSISFLTSGYHGLYSEQKIVYSKYTSKFINRKVEED